MCKKEFVFEKGRERVDVTIVLNIWKRNHIEKQLTSLLSQTVLPKEIWVIHYENHVDIEEVISKYKHFYPDIVVIHSDKNLRYFGRFSFSINITTQFAWLLDDDVIPGKLWLERCVGKSEKLNAIISCSGRIIPHNNFEPEKNGTINREEYFVGDMTYLFRNYCEKDTLVDYACNSYFFQTKWLKTYWSIWPATFDTGEDIHLSATCKNMLGIPTYVLEQRSTEDSGNLKKVYGHDDTATWRHANFVSLRKRVLEYHILQKNWKPLLWVNKE